MGSVNIELYNSSFCRLCSLDCEQSGIFIFNNNSSENISISINKYLHLEVSDDRIYPQKICSKCHGKLVSTISFFKLVSEGQKKLQDLVKPTHFSIKAQETNELLKRRRGRPRKSHASVSVQSSPVLLDVVNLKETSEAKIFEETSGKYKRKRKLPSRFSSSLQGKELEKVYRDVGLPEDEIEALNSTNAELIEPTVTGNVIGKLETLQGEDLGKVMVHQPSEEVNRKQIKYSCDTCELVFTREYKFLAHQLSHDLSAKNHGPLQSASSKKKDVSKDKDPPKGEKESYDCEICNKKFKYLSSLSYHKGTEHNDGRRYVCNKCPRSFKHHQLLRRHQIVHTSLRTHVCEECGSSFKTKGSLLNHMLTHTGIKKYFCETCGHMFAHRTSLLLHMRWHNGEKPFECDVCHKRFSQKGNLQEHMRTHTGEKPFECSACGRRFTTSSQCKIHMKRHTGERPWFCNYCEKTFLNKATWRCHLRRHKGEKPYECDICGNKFSEIWALRKHRRAHTGEKPYVCPTCGKAFSDCSNLSKHKKSHLKAKLSGKETNMSKAKKSYQKTKVSEEEVDNGQVLFLNSYQNMKLSEEGENEQVIYLNSDPKEKLSEESGENGQVVYLNSNQKMKLPEEEGGNDQVFYLNYIDSIDPNSEVSEKFILDNKASQSTNEEVILQVVDELGNPMKFTLQDGTQLEVASDGRNLVMRTHDGQSIPVGLTDSLGPVTPVLTPVVIHDKYYY